MKQPTLFDSEHDQAVRDMIALFQGQLKSATSDEERELLRLAIRGWESTLGPPMPCTAMKYKRTRAQQPRK